LNIDLKILDALNSVLTNRNHALDLLVIFLANYLVYVFAAIAVLYWFWNSAKLSARKAVLLAFVSFVLARGVVTEIIRHIYARPRPDIPHPIIDMSQKQFEASFPSGHATAMFSIAMSIYFYNKKLGWWMFGMAAVTAVFRVAIGVHYPSDVLAGAVFGILTSWLVEKIAAGKIDGLVLKLSNLSDRIFPWTGRP